MWSVLGAIAIASAVAILAGWRARWAVAASLALATTGFVVVHERPREQPMVERPLGDRDADRLCGLIGSELASTGSAIAAARRFGWEPMTDHLRGRWDAMQRFARRVMDICTPTMETCSRMLDRAQDPAEDAFFRASMYVGQAFMRRKGCEDELPANPDRNYPL